MHKRYHVLCFTHTLCVTLRYTYTTLNVAVTLRYTYTTLERDLIAALLLITPITL
jgi:hypothetical protein